ncbi:MAG: glutathione S-transferase family protein [Thiotrichaceae bacterium]
MITLYQFDSCPFCWKVKALLNYAKQPYETVEVSPFGMKELDFTDHKKVPVLKDGDEVITESAKIVEHVNTHYSKLPVRDDASKWTQWIDDTLVHYLPPIIHPNFSTSMKNFKTIMANVKMNPIKRTMVKFAGSIVMPKVAKKMKAKYGIEDASGEFLTAIDKWVDSGLNGQPFFGGDQPDFIDCSLFGVLHSSHDLGVITLASEHNADFTTWYNACLPLMSSKTS